MRIHLFIFGIMLSQQFFHSCVGFTGARVRLSRSFISSSKLSSVSTFSTTTHKISDEHQFTSSRDGKDPLFGSRLSFDQIGISPELSKKMSSLGCDTSTNIQAKAVGPILAGGDVVIAAETGSGER
jgi:hypothetical protein